MNYVHFMNYVHLDPCPSVHTWNDEHPRVVFVSGILPQEWRNS